MYVLKIVNRKLSRYFDVGFLWKMILILGTLYIFNVIYIALKDPGGLVYSAFLSNDMDYISWMRNSILYTSNFIAHQFGLNTYISDSNTVRISHGNGVIVGMSCLGFGIITFWIAFVTAHQCRWQNKLTWTLAGATTVWYLNCLRVALLLLAIDRKWTLNKYMDHHSMFNIIIYMLVMMMMYLFYKVVQPQPESVMKEPSMGGR